jgi:hypothetical protein
MTKTLNQIFFSSTKIRIFFSTTLGIRIIKRKKNNIWTKQKTITPCPSCKINGRSLSNAKTELVNRGTEALYEVLKRGRLHNLSITCQLPSTMQSGVEVFRCRSSLQNFKCILSIISLFPNPKISHPYSITVE